jgi:hypothetical protein
MGSLGLSHYPVLVRMFALPFGHEPARDVAGLRVTHLLAGFQPLDLGLGLSVAKLDDYSTIFGRR